MGYAKMGQNTAGIHMRLRSRAFIIGDSTGSRVVLVTVDICMISQIVKIEVSRRLQENPKYGRRYSRENVLLSGTHTHSGPGGFLQYLLYLVPSAGFVRQNFEAIVSGILLVSCLSLGDSSN